VLRRLARRDSQDLVIHGGFPPSAKRGDMAQRARFVQTYSTNGPAVNAIQPDGTLQALAATKRGRAALAQQIHRVAGLDVRTLCTQGVEITDDAVDAGTWPGCARWSASCARNAPLALFGLPAVAVSRIEESAGRRVMSIRSPPLAMVGDIFAIGRVGDLQTPRSPRFSPSVNCP